MFLNEYSNNMGTVQMVGTELISVRKRYVNCTDIILGTVLVIFKLVIVNYRVDSYTCT